MKINFLFGLLVFSVAILIVYGCATSPYKRIEEKRLHQTMSQANEFYALGQYAIAGRLYNKAVQLAVIRQAHLMLAEAQFKYALSLERSFQTRTALTTAWKQARYYSEKYNYRPFTVELGWFNWRINHGSTENAKIMNRQLKRFQKTYPPESIDEKVQLFNFMAKWHLSIGTPEKASDFLDQAQSLINESGSDKGLGLILFNKAMVAVLKGNLDLSLDFLQDSLALDSRDNNISGVYANLQAQANIFDMQGKPGQANIIREQFRNTRNYILGKSP
jgi:tetratricopeptide (TPR) repeat protein